MSCPFLDTIDRQVINFDFEKQCSVTLERKNVYICLVCGKLLQGRGEHTPAHAHSLQAKHFVFMNLDTRTIYCLPDNYVVEDSSLEDIIFNLHPTLKPSEIQRLDVDSDLKTDVFGSTYIPGFGGMTNAGAADFLNASVQALMRVIPFRNFFLNRDNFEDSPSPIVRLFGECVCKLWNPRRLKSSVSALELLQEVSKASKNRFGNGKQCDANEFLKWLLHQLHIGSKSNVIHECFQGRVQVTTEWISSHNSKECPPASTKEIPMLLVSLDLPDSPLFKDSREGKSLLPEIMLKEALQKFNGENSVDILHDGMIERKCYRILEFPKYLILHMNRFKKNQWGIEKNHTLVHLTISRFDASNLELSRSSKRAKLAPLLYSLVANICHKSLGDSNEEAKLRNGLSSGVYFAQVLNNATKQWYEIEDLVVEKTMPQLVQISESFIAVYKKEDSSL